MRDTRTTAVGLRSAIERSGYYPGLVADAVFSALGAEAVVSYVVQSDALFDPAVPIIVSPNKHGQEPALLGFHGQGAA